MGGRRLGGIEPHALFQEGCDPVLGLRAVVGADDDLARGKVGDPHVRQGRGGVVGPEPRGLDPDLGLGKETGHEGHDLAREVRVSHGVCS